MLGLKSNTGRQFIYQNEAVSDKNGSFEITVPYSTENTGSEVGATIGLFPENRRKYHSDRNPGKGK